MFGRSSGSVSACTAPTSGKWATTGGDCNDDRADVNPDQPSYLPSPYDAGSGQKSFDYDCSGVEESDPTEFGAAPNCGLLSLLGCGGAGFVATGRTGPGVNPLCGSTSLITCTSNGVACKAVPSEVSEGHRCR